MVDGELGEFELQYYAWQQSILFWKKLHGSNEKPSQTVYRYLRIHQPSNRWLNSIHNILINCGVPELYTYVAEFSDVFKKYFEQDAR